MPITEEQLLRIFPNAGPRAGVFVPALNRAMMAWSINSSARQAAFLAQAGHESAELTRLVESLNYSAQRLAAVWPRRFRDPEGWPNALAQQLAGKPELIANTVYAGRNGNGNIQSGDGWRFRGRGLLQVTGRANYRRVGQGLGLPLEDEPDLLAQPNQAARSAAWWWADAGLNALADAGRFEDITRRINGGLNGLAERQKLWRRALAALAGPG